MGLRRAVGTPFLARGTRSLPESEFVVVLSLDRDWFSPDQAKRLIDVALGEGVLERTDEGLAPTFDPDAVDVPEGFTPDESLLRERSTFERVLDALIEAGIDKQTAVAETNRLQSDLAITLEAAAVLFATRQGVDVTDLAERAREDL
jgi:hypothetical protein